MYCFWRQFWNLCQFFLEYYLLSIFGPINSLSPKINFGRSLSCSSKEPFSFWKFTFLDVILVSSRLILSRSAKKPRYVVLSLILSHRSLLFRTFFYSKLFFIFTLLYLKCWNKSFSTSSINLSKILIFVFSHLKFILEGFAVAMDCQRKIFAEIGDFVGLSSSAYLAFSNCAVQWRRFFTKLFKFYLKLNHLISVPILNKSLAFYTKRLS